MILSHHPPATSSRRGRFALVAAAAVLLPLGVRHTAADSPAVAVPQLELSLLPEASPIVSEENPRLGYAEAETDILQDLAVGLINVGGARKRGKPQ